MHDREDEKMELFVTKNFGETFSHAGDYIKSFYFDHREVAALLKIRLLKSCFRTRPFSMSRGWSPVAS